MQYSVGVDLGSTAIEAIYDVTDIADYIEEEFGQQRADRFQSNLKEQMQNLGQFSTAFPRTQEPVKKSL